MSCNRSQKEQIKTQIRQTYSWFTDEQLNSCYDMALSDYLTIRYPSENNRPSPEGLTIDFFISQWIYKRMIDIFGRAGGLSLTAYKENNLNFSYGASYIDPELYSLITPKAGVPR